MGKVILKNILGFDAPSILAASYRDWGTCLRADKNNTMEEPNCHISSIQMVITAISGVPSHLTGPMWTRPRRLLMKPSFINSTFHRIATATEPLSRDGM